MSNSNWWDDMGILDFESGIVDKPKSSIVPKAEDTESDILGMLSSLGFLSGDAPQSKAKKVTKKASKTVVKAEQVIEYDAPKIYDTLDDLVIPNSDCTHYWQIPSEGAWQIGVCKYCNGEKWFCNSYSILTQEQNKFNNSPFPLTVEDAEAKREAVRDIEAIEESLIDSSLERSSFTLGEALV